MRKAQLTMICLLLAGCASTPQREAISSADVSQIFTQFETRDGKVREPIRGKYKEATFETTSGLGNPTFDCSGTDTYPMTRYLDIYTDNQGMFTGKLNGVDCGRSFGPISISGLQTRNKFYVREANGKQITSFDIESGTGRLMKDGYYRSYDGTITFTKARQNNETWKKEGFSKGSYKTSGYVPQRNWSEVDRFARVEGRKATNGSSGFNWGKALALGAGSLIGGGGSLNADQQAAVLGGIIADSMEGVDGVSNMENSIDSVVTAEQRKMAGTNALSSISAPSQNEYSSDSSLSVDVSNSNIASESTSPPATGGVQSAGSKVFFATFHCVSQSVKVGDEGHDVWAYVTPKLMNEEERNTEAAYKSRAHPILREKVRQIIEDKARFQHAGGIYCYGGYTQNEERSYGETYLKEWRKTVASTDIAQSREVHFVDIN